MVTNSPVTVTVEERGPYAAGDPRRIVVTAPGKYHRIRAQFGDVVEWTFDNQTAFDLQLGVGNFRAADQYKGIDEKRDLPVEPLPAGTACNVAVGKHKTVALKCRVGKQPGPIKPGEGRTFKYDIIDYSRLLVFLDPELEVYP